MEDHVTVPLGTGSGPVTTVTDSAAAADADLNLRVLCDRVRVLEQNASSINQSDSYLQNRITDLERSEKTVLSQLSQLASSAASPPCGPSMQPGQRLDQKLHGLREEVRNMTREKERGERVWRDRLQRCQNQLRTKEEEMIRQSQYFHNYKAQLQHKLSLARDGEQSLQSRVHALEKQLLDVTVSAATNMATISGMMGITAAGSMLQRTTRLPYLRGEGEGEEEEGGKKKQQQQGLGCRGRGEQEEDQGDVEKKVDGGGEKETGEARLQGFILSLQEDLRVLLEREERVVEERRTLTEQLQEAQENGHFLACAVEETKAEVRRLEMSESSLTEVVEELREENQQLHQLLTEVADQVPGQTPATPRPSSSPSSPVLTSWPSLTNSTAVGRCSADSAGKAEQTQDEPTFQLHPAAPTPVHQRGAGESNPEDHTSSAVNPDTLPLPQPDLLNLSAHLNSTKLTPGLLTLPLATETVEVEGFSMGVSEETEALREAYRSLGLGEDLEDLREQRDHLEEQLLALAQENTRLKSQLREQAEERGSSGLEMNMVPTQTTTTTRDDIDDLPSSPTHDDDNILDLVAHNDLARALNRENRVLATRIQELMTHMELREGDSTRAVTQLRTQVSRLEADRGRLEQESQEQGCLITELTRKTEDDLNTILELQQKIEDGGQRGPDGCPNTPEGGRRGVQVRTDVVPETGSGKQKELMEGSLNGPPEGKDEPGSVSTSHRANRLPSDSARFSQQGGGDRTDSPSDRRRDDPNASPRSDKVERPAESSHALKEEREELLRSLSSLREEGREAALSVQSQTEEKQQLTRSVWGLKEERDRIVQSLHDLTQERDKLTRTVCGLRDERDQFSRSMSGLREEKEQLTESASGLREEREKLLESLSSEKEERDRIAQSQRGLREETEQLSRSVVHLKQERSELTNSLRCLEEQRDREQASRASAEARDELSRSVCGLKEERERVECSLSGLRREKEQIMLSLSGLREERDGLQAEVAMLHSQSRAEGWSQGEHLANRSHAGMATRAEVMAIAGEHAAPRNQTAVCQKFVQDEKQCDLLREIEALGAELRKSREELDKSQFEAQSWYSELVQSEARREEAQQRAAQAANEVTRMADVANQLEETREENDTLTSQVKGLQSRLTGLAREQADTLLLRTQLEQQFTVLQAQLKAKTVALEELNSEYTALRRDQGSREECSITLASLRARYDDIRAKYDVLLKRKSQTELDIAPLKAKLSCLVMKCQERNGLLLQMMRTMRRQGCLDLPLAQHAEHLLSDAALQDYTSKFTVGDLLSDANLQDYTSKFTVGDLLSDANLQDYTSKFTVGDLLSGATLQDYTSKFTGGDLLSGATLQDYTSKFTGGDGVQDDYSSGLTPKTGFKLQDLINGFTPDRNHTGFTPGVKPVEYQYGFTSVSSVKCQGTATSGNHIGVFTPESTAKQQDCSSEFTLAAPKVNSPVPTDTTQKHANVLPPPSPVVLLDKGSTSLAVASSVKQQTPPSAHKPLRPTGVPDRYGPYQSEVRGGIDLVPGGFSKENQTPHSSAPPSPDRNVCSNRRLSSPEKIINIHHQLQTLSSSYQTPVGRRGVAELQAEGRGRGQQPRRGLSNSAARASSVASQTKSQSLGVDRSDSTPIPAAAVAPSRANSTTLTNKPAPTARTPTTLFTAVASRSANVTLSPGRFAHTPSKAAWCNTTTTTLTGAHSSSTTMASNNINDSLSSSKANMAVTTYPTLPKPTGQTITATVSDTTRHTVTTTLNTTRTSPSVTNNVSSTASAPTLLACTVSNPTSTTASNNNTAPGVLTAPEANTPQPAQRINSIAAAVDHTTPIGVDGVGLATRSARATPPSPERPPLASGSGGRPGKGKAVRPNPEAPIQVGSVEVIRSVGQSSLLIGWERPLLDELGCSNGTFVYGYRVYVDGEFHKSVMSSACTKCILENVDLSAPVHIGVQTLGSSGLNSNRVHTVYRTSFRTDHDDSVRTDHLTGSQSASPGYKTPSTHRHSQPLLSQPSSSNSSKSSPPSPGTEAKTCMAIYSYSPLRDSPNLHPSRELALLEGDTVTLLANPRHDGFCEAQVNGRRGLAPMAVLEELVVSEPRPMHFTS